MSQSLTGLHCGPKRLVMVISCPVFNLKPHLMTVKMDFIGLFLLPLSNMATLNKLLFLFFTFILYFQLVY